MVDDQESASEVLELLQYEEGTAGALMGVELIKVEEDWTVARAIREIRAQASDVENIYTIYVVSKEGVLKGRLYLKSLLLNASSARSILKELIDDDDFGLASELQLCREARVLLTRNLWVEAGLVNGSMGTVKGFVWPQGGNPTSSDPKKRAP